MASPSSSSHSLPEWDERDEPRDSIADLAAMLGVQETEHLLVDEQFELPQCLVDREEHELELHDPATLPPNSDPNYTGPNAPMVKGFWVKVSSVDALLQSCTMCDLEEKLLLLGHPLYVFLLPSIPLDDARRISEMEPLRLNVASIRVLNDALLRSKVASFQEANRLMSAIQEERNAVKISREGLTASIQPQLERLREHSARYQEAKAAYQAARGTAEEMGLRFRALAAASSRLVASRVVNGMKEALASVESLDESMAKSTAELEAAIKRPTFMGCPCPANVPPRAAGDGTQAVEHHEAGGGGVDVAVEQH